MVNDVGINVFEYYTQQESELFAYYSIPKELFINSKYKDMSSDAKLLYSLLLDRNSLSIKNGWADNEGHIYIICTREEIWEELGISFKKAVKLFEELKDVLLIEEVKQGLDGLNIIYVRKMLTENKGNEPVSEFPIPREQKNRYQAIALTNTSNTDMSNSFPRVSSSSLQKMSGGVLSGKQK